MLPQVQQHACMDESIEAFREQVRRDMAAELSPHLDGWRRQGFIPRQVWRGFGDMGFLLPEMDEADGGAGASLAHQLVVQDEMAKAEMAATTGVHSIATHDIRDYGTDAQKARWLPRLTSGEMLAAIAMTEPGCGSDLKAISTKARLDGDHAVIDGAKTVITNGFTSNLLVLVARTGDPGSRGLSLIVLATEELPGYRVGRVLEKIGQHASDTAELFFDGVRVPADQLLDGKPSLACGQLMGQLPDERLLSALPAAAVIELALALTVDDTRQRKAFGQTLYDFRNTRFKLAEVATTAHIVRSFVNDCIQRLLDGKLDNEAAHMAKWWCTEQQCRVTNECLQLFGGFGDMAEYPIARLYTASRVQNIFGGAHEVVKDLIAKSL